MFDLLDIPMYISRGFYQDVEEQEAAGHSNDISLLAANSETIKDVKRIKREVTSQMLL